MDIPLKLPFGGKLPNLAKGALWIGALQAVRIVLSLTGMALLLSRFAPAEYGLIAIAVAAAELSMACLIFVQVAVQVYATRLIHENDGRGLTTMLWCAYALRLSSAGLVSLAVLLLAEPVAAFYRHPELGSILVPIAWTALARSVDGPVETNLMYVEKRYSAIFVLGVLEGGGLFLANLLALVMPLSAPEYALAYALSWMPRNIYCWFLLRRFGVQHGLAVDRSAIRGWMKRLIRFSAWHTGTTVLNSATINGSTLIIGRSLGLEATAIYSVAITFLRRLMALVFSPDTIFVSRIAQASRVSTRHMLERLVAYYSVFGMFAAFCATAVLVYAPEVIVALGGWAYEQSSLILQTLTVVICVRSVEIARHMAYAGGQTRRLFWVVLVRTAAEFALLGVAAWLGSLQMAVAAVIAGAAVGATGVVITAARGTGDALANKFIAVLLLNMLGGTAILAAGVALARLVPVPWAIGDMLARSAIGVVLILAMGALFRWTYTQHRRPFLEAARGAEPAPPVRFGAPAASE